MTLIWRPGFQFDTDASNYIEAVEGPAGDNQALETATRYAINDFVIGCKQDGIWSAIKASCILSGARTLAGALVPLAGTAPTNVGGLFVSGDYNRKTGLVGDGSTKYLNSNRNNNADPQDNHHQTVFASTIGSADQIYMGAGAGNTGSTQFGTALGGSFGFRNRNSAVVTVLSAATTGFIGHTRSSSSTFISTVSKVTSSNASISQTPFDGNVFVFARSTTGASPGIFTNARLAFYSIGESLNLALLDARVSALITAFGVAIP
jgi:hypothetical protein